MIKNIIVASVLAIISNSVIAKDDTVNNVILVHGAYADGSGWKPVFENLRKEGYNVYIAQLPETSLKEDVASVNRLVDYINDDVILVGHSYGGVVITEAGNNPDVKGLVYISAVVPDANENIKDLRVKYKAPANDVIKLGDGFQILNPETYHNDFAADLPKDVAEFMAYSQVPVAVPYALGAKVSKAAWKDKPSWYLVAKDDRKINPDLLRFMAKRAGSNTIEASGSHAIFRSQPKVVSDLIITASENVQ
ncbi:alpha/beta hydrolase [Photobacterium damselae]|uniref:alpha/beta fold hydrolase n=1 Tax=Photobacterium damselae TaxID=38293 RepID=UPI002543C50D